MITFAMHRIVLLSTLWQSLRVMPGIWHDAIVLMRELDASLEMSRHWNVRVRVMPGGKPPEQLQPGDYVMDYAECLSEGVRSLVPRLFCVPRPAQVPAAHLRFAKQQADLEVGNVRPKGLSQNAARDAHRFVRRWGLSWRVPVSSWDIAEGGCPEIKVPGLSPKSWIKFLLEKAPELLTGGYFDRATQNANLESFWRCYEKIHPDHEMRTLPDYEARRAFTIPVSLHGDEGRGLKKGQTFVMMVESNLGLETSAKRKHDGHESCKCAKRLRTNAGFVAGAHAPSKAETQVVNLKGHSFLTKFVLCALPNKIYKPEEDGYEEWTDPLRNLFRMVCKELRDLAVNGIKVGETQWYVQCTGVKGDLDFFRKFCSLERTWKKQIGVNLPMCHECMAGGPNEPFEDCGPSPAWAQTLWRERPWPRGVNPGITELLFDSNRPERALRRDIFHNTKMGIFRDFIGSCVLLCCWLGYFNIEGESNRKEILLRRAHSSFKMYCMAFSKAAGLRSFSPLFFNHASWSAYPWVNCKGSDSMLLLQWLRLQVTGFQRDLLDPAHTDLFKMMHAGVKYAIDFTELTYSHPLWLSRACASNLASLLNSFLRVYRCLASWSMQRYAFAGFGMKGKLHMVCHTKHELAQWLSDPALMLFPNPQLWGCEMNEDVVGRISRLSRRCSHRVVQSRTLELYLIKCKALHVRFVSQHKSKR